MSVSDTFPRLLQEQAARRAAAVAMREKRRGIWHAWTWREFSDEVVALASALAARGLRRGDHVALLGESRPRLHAVMAATQCLGGVIVPLYADASVEELIEPLRQAGVTHALAENQEQVDKLLAALPACPALKCIVYDKDRGLRHYAQPELVSYAALLAQGRRDLGAAQASIAQEIARGRAEDPACVLYTAGTRGAARGVVLSHAALIDRARTLAALDGLDASDVSLAYLPPAWVAQHLFSYALPLVTGGCVCCPESSDTMLADMREIGPTLFLATPRVLEALQTQVFVRMGDAGPAMQALYRRGMALATRLGSAGPGDASLGDRLGHAAVRFALCGPLRDVLGLSRIREAYCTGEALGADQLAFYRAIGVKLKQFYGPTEAAGLVTLQRGSAVQAAHVGPATPGVEIKLSPEGEVMVRTPAAFSAYMGAAGEGALSTQDGWLRTGDAGELDAQGQLRIVDRLHDIGRLADGRTFAPKAVENRLKFSPYIHEAVVFGTGHDGLVALIDLEGATVGPWADRHEIAYAGHADLVAREEVQGLMAEVIAQVNAQLARDPATAVAQVRRFAVLPKPLDPDDGVMTRMRKLRREAIAARHAALIEAMHQGLDRLARPDAPGAAPELRIGTAMTYPAERAHAA